MGPRRLAGSLGLCLSLLLSLALPGLAQESIPSGSRRIEDPLQGVTSAVPEGWQELGNGTYARGTIPDDLTVLAVQSVAAPPDQLWPSLLPQFAMDAIPESTGSLQSNGYDWTLYRFDVTAGGLSVAIEMALAQDDGSTHLILLQADPAEFDGLRDQVLLPALEAFDVLAPEPTPDPASLGYAVEEVGFPGGNAGVELAGTLTLPSGDGPFPAVVLMSGSGAQDRDESLRPAATIKPFALLADALTSAGLAVLRYDDRGVGGSTGDYAAATIDDLTADGRAALEYLRSRPDIDPAHIGLLGHSEGGLYAAKLAAADPDIAFVVGMAAPAVDGVSLLVEQAAALQRSRGASDADIDAARRLQETALPALLAGDQVTLDAALTEYFGGIWDRATDDERAIAGERQGFIDRESQAARSQYGSDWMRSLLAYDPALDWQQVGVPVLGLYGGKDVQVVAEQSEPALRAALDAGGNEVSEIIVLDDANHLFQAAESGAVEEYGALPAAFTADFLPTLIDWVTEHAGLAG